MGDKIIESADELYSEISRRGLEIRKEDGRDNSLFRQLCHDLGCPNDQLMAFLKKSNFSAKRFLITFLNIVKPFSQMFAEIWSYLSSNYAPKAGEAVSLRYGFPDSEEAQTIDLEQFRRYAEMTQKVETTLQSTIWPAQAFSQLFLLADKLLDQDKQNDVRTVGYRTGDNLQLPSINVISTEMDEVIRDIRNLFQRIIDDYRVEEQKREGQETNEPLTNAASALTDLMPIWYLIFTTISSISEKNKKNAYTFYNQQIKPHLLNINEMGLLEVKTALDVLDLPFWKHRWHTYEIWCTITVLDALGPLMPETRIVDGRIPLDGYRREVIAYLRKSSHPKACIVIQEQTDIVIGDRQAMKPDLRICFSDVHGDKDNTAAAIEFKQRKDITLAHVEGVLLRYKAGAPRSGGTVIANFDMPGLKLKLPDDCYYFEGVQPGNPKQVDNFTSELLHILQRINFDKFGNNVVLLDISSSMGNLYESPVVNNSLKMIEYTKRAQVFCFNDELKEVDLSRSITTEGGTELPKSLRQLIHKVGKIDRLLIVSDQGYKLPRDLLTGIAYRECMPDQVAGQLSWTLAYSDV